MGNTSIKYEYETDVSSKIKNKKMFITDYLKLKFNQKIIALSNELLDKDISDNIVSYKTTYYIVKYNYMLVVPYIFKQNKKYNISKYEKDLKFTKFSVCNSTKLKFKDELFYNFYKKLVNLPKFISNFNYFKIIDKCSDECLNQKIDSKEIIKISKDKLFKPCGVYKLDNIWEISFNDLLTKCINTFNIMKNESLATNNLFDKFLYNLFVGKNINKITISYIISLKIHFNNELNYKKIIKYIAKANIKQSKIQFYSYKQKYNEINIDEYLQNIFQNNSNELNSICDLPLKKYNEVILLLYFIIIIGTMDNVLHNYSFHQDINKLYLKLIIKNDDVETLLDYYNQICMFNDYFKFNENEKYNREKYFDIIQGKILAFSQLLIHNESNLKESDQFYYNNPEINNQSFLDNMKLFYKFTNKYERISINIAHNNNYKYLPRLPEERYVEKLIKKNNKSNRYNKYRDNQQIMDLLNKCISMFPEELSTYLDELYYNEEYKSMKYEIKKEKSEREYEEQRREYEEQRIQREKESFQNMLNKHSNYTPSSGPSWREQYNNDLVRERNVEFESTRHEPSLRIWK